MSSVFPLSRAFTCLSYGYFADPDDCKNYYYCDFDFQATLHTCPTGTYFNTRDQDCSETKCLDATTPVNITCTSSQDIFPDPHDHHKYFECDAYLNLVHEECFEGKGCYDPNKEICLENADTDGNCPDIPPAGMKCNKTADMFPDPDDPHKYFECDASLNLVHEECFLGKGCYDPNSQTCVKAVDSQGNCPDFPPSDMKCNTSHDVFADPDDPHKYFECDASLNLVHEECFQGKGCYDPNSQLCVDNADADGNCPDIPPAGLKCTSGKELYPDPDDPHNYYQCDASMNLELRQCFQGHGCYDPNNEACVEVADSEGNCPDFPTSGMKCNSTHDLLPDPYDCHNYYICDASHTLIPGRCDNGYFNSTSYECVSSVGPCPDTT